MSAWVAISKIVGTILLKKITEKAWSEAENFYDNWKKDRQQMAMSFSAAGQESSIQRANGVLQAGQVFPVMPVEQLLLLNGFFYADSSFVEFAEDILDHSEKSVLIFIFDENTQNFIVADFGFEGYSISMPPGIYSMYACIIDPVLDEFLAIGYPKWSDEQDPNPVRLYGSGSVQLDFVLFEVDDDLDELDDDDDEEDDWDDEDDEDDWEDDDDDDWDDDDDDWDDDDDDDWDD